MLGVSMLPERDRALIKEIGQRVQSRRRQLRLTQDELAERANLSSQYVGCVESGLKGLREETIIKLSKALQVSADYILFGTAGGEDYRQFDDMIRPLSGKELLGLEEMVKVYLMACGHSEWD